MLKHMTVPRISSLIPRLRCSKYGEFAPIYQIRSLPIRLGMLLMAKTLPLLRGSITVSEALAEDEDVIQDLSYPENRLDFLALSTQLPPPDRASHRSAPQHITRGF